MISLWSCIEFSACCIGGMPWAEVMRAWFAICMKDSAGMRRKDWSSFWTQIPMTSP